MPPYNDDQASAIRDEEINPTPEQWKALNGTLTAFIQQRIREQIPNPGDNPLLNEILDGMGAGIYSLQGREDESIEIAPSDSPLERIRKESTVVLRGMLNEMGYASSGAVFGLFLVHSSAPTNTWLPKSCSGSCPPTGYGTCWYWC